MYGINNWCSIRAHDRRTGRTRVIKKQSKTNICLFRKCCDEPHNRSQKNKDATKNKQLSNQDEQVIHSNQAEEKTEENISVAINKKWNQKFQPLL